MKKLLFYPIIVWLISISTADAQTDFYIDELGNQVDKITFMKKWRDKDLLLSRWDSIGNNQKRYAKLNRNLYQAGVLDFGYIKKELEKITDKTISDSTTIVLLYRHKDDLCSRKSDNNYYSRSEINERKKWLKPSLKKLEDKNIFFLYLFEKGITLKTKKNSKKEIFFSDDSNFFKEIIFKAKALCGSVAAIKPNGETLVRNGEGSLYYINEYLFSKNWSALFRKKDN